MGMARIKLYELQMKLNAEKDFIEKQTRLLNMSKLSVKRIENEIKKVQKEIDDNPEVYKKTISEQRRS